jgi:hypothetical protein
MNFKQVGFYRIASSRETDTIGCEWPQVQIKGILGIDNDINTISKIRESGLMMESAIPTDFLSSAELPMSSMIIHKRVVELLQQCNMPRHILKEMNIDYKDDTLEDYSIIAFEFLDDAEICFEESIFFVASRLRPSKDREDGLVDIKAYEDIKRYGDILKKDKNLYGKDCD